MNQYITEQNFHEIVEKKFYFLNSVFLGITLSNNSSGKILYDFHDHVLKLFSEKRGPDEIIESFFSDITDEDAVMDRIFEIIKYIERQVVLFDAVEDAAFDKINNLNGPNSLKYVIGSAVADGKSDEVMGLIKHNRVRLVLTAHPTQFYPGTILSIINDLQTAIRDNDLLVINTLLAQLSYTPFFSKKKPTPYDEAVNIIWYLENIFYDTVLGIQETVASNLPGHEAYFVNPKLVELGFWPGGDRDGNPFVTADITLNVANRLRTSILKKYHEEIRKLKRKLTFKNVYDILENIESSLYDSIHSDTRPLLSESEFLEKLEQIRLELEEKYDGLYSNDILKLINTIKIFQYHFATLDIRQDNRTHHSVLKEILESSGKYDEYKSLDDDRKAKYLLNDFNCPGGWKPATEKSAETVECIRIIKTIQALNGEAGCNRYIISNCSSETDVYELMALFLYAGWDMEQCSMDFVPLFETISDLENAASVMTLLYENKLYREHLKKRNNSQTIMLGFSDGTKDGGYFTANWSIYRAKESLSAVSGSFDIDVIFFDGRGGPAARGGGKTHDFYASHGRSIENSKIHLTVQGQTISSNFGTVTSAGYNIEGLISAGLKNRLYSNYNDDFTSEDRQTMNRISALSYESYTQLKNDESFIGYLLERTALPYFGMANIGSRPDKRKSPEKFSLNDLRAIPFVGSWTLNRQNIPGYYGLGQSLDTVAGDDDSELISGLFKRSLFFRTLLRNSMMVLKKTNFLLTDYMSNDQEYSKLWKKMHDEFLLASEKLLWVTGYEYLMQNNPRDMLSIELRESIILPLCVIHQYALKKMLALKDSETDPERIEKFKHMVIRSSYGIINAGRNSA